MTRGRSLILALAMAVTLVAGAFPDVTDDPRRYLAFTTLNIALLAVALWVALPAIGGAACLLIFAGPTIWWIDKPTGDAAAFSIITVALLILVRRAESKGSALRTSLAVLALLIVIIKPALGRDLHWPSLAEWLAVPLDPSIGVAANFPAVALVLGLGIGARAARRSAALSSDQSAALIAGLISLFAIAQITNQHDETPSMSRYANWLIPLSVPFLREAHARGGARWRRSLWGIAGASAVVCTLLFHPAAKPYAREPTLAASFLWTRHPSWTNPLPEIFSEVLHPGENRVVPAATPQCEKLLVVGAGGEGGATFPTPCFPAEPPPECSVAGVLCYANRDGAAYRFARAPGSAVQHEGFTVEPRFAWPAAATDRVRDLLTQWEWSSLHTRSGGGVLRESQEVRVIHLEGARRHVFLLRQPNPGARITLRLPWHATGALIDPATGQTIRTLTFTGEPSSRWDVDVPSGFELLLVFLQAS